jgi:hypothetical protein
VNITQHDRMIAELAQIFDKVATTCTHATQAAHLIEQRLKEQGFAIVAKKKPSPRANRLRASLRGASMGGC